MLLSLQSNCLLTVPVQYICLLIPNFRAIHILLFVMRLKAVTSNALNRHKNALVQRIKGEAKDIHDKYIDPPNTTEFAIMFLPFEGLYSEVVNMGLVEVLQREYKVNIAGPSTMAALLNSLQMGFKTLAVQKRSAEVWKILGGVKTEFDKFNDVLVMTQQRLDQANKELDKLVGVRTRQIQRQLKDVESVSLSEQNLFE